MITISPHVNSHDAHARSLRLQSLGVHGGKLFNCLPIELRNCTDTKETFKIKLDLFLTNIPDQPVCQGLSPEPVSDISCKNSNSIINWVKYLKIGERRTHTDECISTTEKDDYIYTTEKDDYISTTEKDNYI